MKKLFFGLIMGISFTALIGAGYENYIVGKQTANVDKVENILIFMNSKPVMEYEYLGTVKMSISWTGSYSEIRTYLIKSTRKKYPDADAIIINRSNAADVIKFK